MPTYDVAAYQPPTNGTGPYMAALATPTSSGRKIAGVEKLAQRFVLELFTEKGSITFAPTRGSEFMTLLRTSGFMHETDVLSAFDIALLTVTNGLQAEELTSDPDDERFLWAGIIKIAISPEQVILKIQLTTKSGAASVLTYPLSLNSNRQVYTTLD